MKSRTFPSLSSESAFCSNNAYVSLLLPTSCEVWDVKTARLKHTFSTGPGNLSLSVSPLHDTLSVVQSNRSLLFDLKTFSPLPAPEVGSGGCLAFSTVNSRLTATRSEKGVQFFDVVTLRTIKDLPFSDPPTSLKFSPDGTYLAVGGGGRTRVLDLRMPDRAVWEVGGSEGPVVWENRRSSSSSSKPAAPPPVATSADVSVASSVGTINTERVMERDLEPRAREEDSEEDERTVMSRGSHAVVSPGR